MRAVRLGSYSMCATRAGTPSLSTRLKSTKRYWRLCPPPWCRVVIRPCAFRPPLLCKGTTSDFSGVDRVTSTKSATLEPRRPGVVGLYLRIPISQSSSDIGRSGPPSGGRTAEDVDTVALGEGHDRALGGRTLAEAGAGPLA